MLGKTHAELVRVPAGGGVHRLLAHRLLRVASARRHQRPTDIKPEPHLPALPRVPGDVVAVGAAERRQIEQPSVVPESTIELLRRRLQQGANTPTPPAGSQRGKRRRKPVRRWSTGASVRPPPRNSTAQHAAGAADRNSRCGGGVEPRGVGIELCGVQELTWHSPDVTPQSLHVAAQLTWSALLAQYDSGQPGMASTQRGSGVASVGAVVEGAGVGAGVGRAEGRGVGEESPFELASVRGRPRAAKRKRRYFK